MKVNKEVVVSYRICSQISEHLELLCAFSYNVNYICGEREGQTMTVSEMRFPRWTQAFFCFSDSSRHSIGANNYS